jgi:mannose-1-phosphate guanylyltransferase
MIKQWLGYHKPKQFCTFVGTRSMLQHTWDRADRLTAPQQKITVVTRPFRQEVWSQFEDRRTGQVLVQPRNCDTAAGIFLPLTYIRAQNPQATVVLYPSDHFLFPESPFIDTVRHAMGAVEFLTDRVILVGVTPTYLELEYGWIYSGCQVGLSHGTPVYAVNAFLEKPERTHAQAAMEAGALWNTFVLAAKVETLWKMGWCCFPDLMALFERLGRHIGSSKEGRVLESIYHTMPRKNFSSDLLQQIPDRVGVVELRGVIWSDWGRPERIVDTLRALGKAPAFSLHGLHGSVTVSAKVDTARNGHEKTGEATWVRPSSDIH